MAVTNGKQQFIGLITLVKESLPWEKKSDIHLFIYLLSRIRQSYSEHNVQLPTDV